MLAVASWPGICCLWLVLRFFLRYFVTGSLGCAECPNQVCQDVAACGVFCAAILADTGSDPAAWQLWPICRSGRRLPFVTFVDVKQTQMGCGCEESGSKPFQGQAGRQYKCFVLKQLHCKLNSETHLLKKMDRLDSRPGRSRTCGMTI